METNRIGKAMAAGFVATVVLSILMVIKTMMGLMPQLDMIKMLNGMMHAAPIMGWVAHFVIGTIIWGVAFALLEPVLPGNSYWIKGVVFGIGAWILMMIFIMPMAGAGFFGMALGMMAPIMTLILHLIYGAVLGGVYGRLVQAAPGARATAA